MAFVCQSDIDGEPHAQVKNACTSIGAYLVQKSVKTGDILFQAGGDRALYRVERGAICHYMLWSDGRHEVVEFAFPGDIVGLGYLHEHVSTAQAMVDTLVSVITEEEFATHLENDDRLSFRLAAAAEREFDYVRDRTMARATASRPAVRLANFLLAMSNLNKAEGRERELISDDIAAGFVAEKLDMSIENLTDALLRLKKEGAIRETAAGLRIVDAATLQRVADAA